MWPGCGGYGWMRAGVYGFGGVLMFEYDVKIILLRVGAREAFAEESGKCFTCRTREPDARARPAVQQKTTQRSWWPNPRVTRFSCVMI